MKEINETDIEFIRNNYLDLPATDIAHFIGIPIARLVKWQKENNCIAPKHIQYKLRGKKNIGKSICTPEIDQFLYQNYLLLPVKTMANILGLDDGLTRRRLRQLNLVIPTELIEQRKKDSQFKGGVIPINKGKKMDPEQYKKAAKTMFKAGHQPANTKFDGAITVRHNHKERGSPPYQFIRISKGKWEFLHRYVWIQNNGIIPKGKIVVFKDGNTQYHELQY